MTSCATLKQSGHAQIMDNGHSGGGRAEAEGPERRFMVVVKEDVKSDDARGEDTEHGVR